MDVNSSDPNGKPSINNSAEEARDPKGNKNELPPIVRPKFSKRQRRRLPAKSKETMSKDDEPTQEKPDGHDKPSDDKEDEKLSMDRPSMEKPSMEKASAENPDEGRPSRDRDTRDQTIEKETEEPECRESETNIVVVEQKDSGTDVKNLPTPTVILEDKSDEKKKKGKGGDSVDDGEKQKKKKGSRRGKKKKHRKKNSGRNKNHQQQKQQGSDDREKKATKQPNLNNSKESNPSPRQSTYVPLKNDRSNEAVGTKKSKANNKTSDSSNMKTPDKKTPQPPPKKKTNFFKNIFDKTKSWMRKSDDVAQPTKEMLFKSFVSPEYDPQDERNFLPDLSGYQSKEVDIRSISNTKSGRYDVFYNNRPFWVNRTNEDQIPKCKLLSHAGLMAQHSINNTHFLKELPKRKFYDPKNETLEKLMIIDRAIGVDPLDATKEKELRRVTSNTFFGTCMMHAYKNTAEGKRKLEEAEARNKETAVSDEKKAGYVPLKFIFPTFPDKKDEKKEEKKDETVEKSVLTGPMLVTYNRKSRPQPTSTTVRKNASSREFKFVPYVALEPTKKASKHKEVQVVPATSQESHVQKT
ncbi:hypothetical protein CAEBREN_20407 [Caenorhabditis brenneri]|uniref:Uncharacterized protein n=1 Tax=Caenorhabditis brenneri TaxID=135651 RepID=G0NGR3_CAEBE|nr:hypothetical protein CAEBREN_20407 [Caenorhabditis brenneri]